MMDQIFQYSTLTLFAAAGDHADSGLSFPRDPRWHKPCLLNLKTTVHHKTVEGSVYVDVDGAHDSYSPLYGRGWVLQEEILAIRGLVFGRREIRWRCMCGRSSERTPMETCRRRITTIRDLGSPTGLPEKIQYSCEVEDGFNYLRMWIQDPDPLPDRVRYRNDKWFRDNHFDHWYSMVENYSRRELTRESDELPALAGIATAMAKTHNCKYLAGLWHEDLQTGLCWYVSARRRFHERDGQSKAAKGPALLWSWICRNFPIGWLYVALYNDIRTHEALLLAVMEMLLKLVKSILLMNLSRICENYRGGKPLLMDVPCIALDPPKNQPDSAEVSAPSWSWISRRGEYIKFQGWENEDLVIKMKMDGLSRAIQNVAEFPNLKAEGFVELRNAPDVIVTSPPQSPTTNPYITVTQKTLVLSGRLKMAVVEEKHNPLGAFSGLDGHGEWEREVRDPDTGQQLGRIMFDFNPEGLQIKSVFCFLCAKGDRLTKWELTCLGLLPIDNATNRFTRIGLIILTVPKWFGMSVSEGYYYSILTDRVDKIPSQTIQIS